MAKLLTKDFKKSILRKIVPRVAYFVINLLYLTCRKRFHSDIKAEDLKRPVIFTFWHGELLSAIKGYSLFKRDTKIDAIISEHNDGELIARVVLLFNGGVIRGSSTRGSIGAIKSSFKTLERGRNLGITPDGPKGPRHSVADGVVLISQKKGVPIVTFNCKPTSYWQINSWDKFIVPKPFCTLDFYIGKPFDLDGLSMVESKRLIRERLLEHAI